MAALIDTVGPCKIKTERDPWVALFSAVVYQQVSGGAAKAVCGRIKAYWHGRLPNPDEVLRAERGKLRRLGLSTRKEETLRDVAQRVHETTLDLGGLAAAPDYSVRHTLTSIKGIGEWTAGMFLLFHLQRPDVILPNDLGLRKAIMMQYAMPNLPTGAEVTETATRWAPFRTYASWYLWKSLPGFPDPGFG